MNTEISHRIATVKVEATPAAINNILTILDMLDIEMNKIKKAAEQPVMPVMRECTATLRSTNQPEDREVVGALAFVIARLANQDKAESKDAGRIQELEMINAELHTQLADIKTERDSLTELVKDANQTDIEMSKIIDILKGRGIPIEAFDGPAHAVERLFKAWHLPKRGDKVRLINGDNNYNWPPGWPTLGMDKLWEVKCISSTSQNVSQAGQSWDQICVPAIMITTANTDYYLPLHCFEPAEAGF